MGATTLSSLLEKGPAIPKSMHKAVQAEPSAPIGANSSASPPLQEGPALLQAVTTPGSHPDHHCAHVLRPDHRVQRQLQGLLDDLGVCGKGERPQQVVLLTGIRSLQWYGGEDALAKRKQGSWQVVDLGMPCSRRPAIARSRQAVGHSLGMPCTA